MYIQQLGEMIPEPSQCTVGVCKQISLLILYYISSRLTKHLKIIHAAVQVSDIFHLTVSFKFIYIFYLSDIPSFCSEMSANLASYIVLA